MASIAYDLLTDIVSAMNSKSTNTTNNNNTNGVWND
jgi:hypothetical protein